MKKYIKEIAIVILLLFSLQKCTQSCSRQTKYDNLRIEADSTYKAKDAQLKELTDSCQLLNTQILIYQERVRGMESALTIQDEAAKRVADAKKNISVTVKQESNGKDN